MQHLFKLKKLKLNIDSIFIIMVGALVNVKMVQVLTFSKLISNVHKTKQNIPGCTVNNIILI